MFVLVTGVLPLICTAKATECSCFVGSGGVSSSPAGQQQPAFPLCQQCQQCVPSSQPTTETHRRVWSLSCAACFSAHHKIFNRLKYLSNCPAAGHEVFEYWHGEGALVLVSTIFSRLTLFPELLRPVANHYHLFTTAEIAVCVPEQGVHSARALGLILRSPFHFEKNHSDSTKDLPIYKECKFLLHSFRLLQTTFHTTLSTTQRPIKMELSVVGAEVAALRTREALLSSACGIAATRSSIPMPSSPSKLAESCLDLSLARQPRHALSKASAWAPCGTPARWGTSSVHPRHSHPPWNWRHLRIGRSSVSFLPLSAQTLQTFSLLKHLRTHPSLQLLLQKSLSYLGFVFLFTNSSFPFNFFCFLCQSWCWVCFQTFSCWSLAGLFLFFLSLSRGSARLTANRMGIGSDTLGWSPIGRDVFSPKIWALQGMCLFQTEEVAHLLPSSQGVYFQRCTLVILESTWIHCKLHRHSFNLYSQQMLVYGSINDLPWFPSSRQYGLAGGEKGRSQACWAR